VWGQGTDGHLYHQSLTNAGWSGWDQDLGITLAANSSPAVTSRSKGNVDVFVTGTDGLLYHKWTVNGAWYGGGMGSWEQHGGFTFKPGTSPAVVAKGLHALDVWGQGTDGHLYHQSLTNAGWSGWDQDLGITLG